jgi:hypothetical protein
MLNATFTSIPDIPGLKTIEADLLKHIGDEMDIQSIDLESFRSIFTQKFESARFRLKIGPIYHLEEYRSAKKEPMEESEKTLSESAFKWKDLGSTEWKYGHYPLTAPDTIGEVWKRGIGREANGLIYSADIMTNEYIRAHWISDFDTWEFLTDMRADWEYTKIEGGGWSYFSKSEWCDILRRNLADLKAKMNQRLEYLNREKSKESEKTEQSVRSAIQEIKIAPSDASSRSRLMTAIIDNRGGDIETIALPYYYSHLEALCL